MECHRVLKSDGTIYVFIGFRYISYLYQILENDLKMNFVNWISWHYTQGRGKTKGFSPRHDDILMFSKSDRYLTVLTKGCLGSLMISTMQTQEMSISTTISLVSKESSR